MDLTRRRGIRRPLALAVALGAVWLPAQAALESHRSSAASRNPLAGESFYVQPSSAAAGQALQWTREGRAADAASMRELAARPTAEWFADGNDVTARARSLTVQAAQAHKTALLVAYYIPGRDCGSQSAGGAASARAYRDWVRTLARGLGTGRAVVIIEPDAIAQSVSGCVPRAARAQRAALLRFAVRKLNSRPGVRVYIDAGNAGWIRPPSRLVGPLRRAGIRSADGFSLNVSNFHRTATTIGYGRALSRRLGGAHFVVDTSRNGNGPGRKDDPEGPNWCNPWGRTLGQDPTTRTHRNPVDAYMWIKTPGISDGSCRAGAPPAGQWWPDYALQLVQNRH